MEFGVFGGKVASYPGVGVCGRGDGVEAEFVSD